MTNTPTSSADSTPDNWREFNNRFQKNHGASFQKLPRYLEENGNRAHRNIYYDLIGKKYLAIQKISNTLEYNLEQYRTDPLLGQAETARFFAAYEEKHQAEINCNTDLSALGFYVPKIDFSFSAKSVSHKIISKHEEDHKKYLALELNFSSVIANDEITGQNISIIENSTKITPLKKNMILEDFFYQAIAIGAFTGNADAVNPTNTILTDIDQARPKQFYSFDHEYAYHQDMDDLMKMAAHYFPRQYANADWDETIDQLVKCRKKMNLTDCKIPPERKKIYEENIASAMDYISSGACLEYDLTRKKSSLNFFSGFMVFETIIIGPA